jgi:two-component system OmpR family response regulator
MRILLIEDDRATADYIAKGLQEIGHVVHVARTGRDGMLLAAGEAWDVIVTDRMLPGPDGLTILRTLRASGITTPVLVLRFEGHTPEALQRIEGEMLALLRSVKPDASFAEAAH